MISRRLNGRKDGKSSVRAALRYGEGLTPDKKTGLYIDKSHRTRLGNFGLVDDGVYSGRSTDEMSSLIELAALEMQSTCDLNVRVAEDKKIAHFVISFNQQKPTDSTLRDTEDSMLAELGLANNHFASFLHNDNGYWHLHLLCSRIEKESPHRGNALWQDKTIRDRVCREVEIRHNLERDYGLHEINLAGQIVEVPRDERRKRQADKNTVTGRAISTEKYSGEKSFQTWCADIRIGDRLKHSKSWQELHAAAADYGCEVMPKGAGFVIRPLGEKGGIQLSKVGLKNIAAKFGAFQTAPKSLHGATTMYRPEPTIIDAGDIYQNWRNSKTAYKAIRIDRINILRDAHIQIRKDLRSFQKIELINIRSTTSGQARITAISVAKMQHTLSLVSLTKKLSVERQELRKQLSDAGPGNTFRDFLVKQADNGNEKALALAQQYGALHSTEVLRKRQIIQLKICAEISGFENNLGLHLDVLFSYKVYRDGTVVFNLGRDRLIVDSPIAQKVLLNNIAAHDPLAIEIALSYTLRKFGNPLILSGPPEFQRLAVETAVDRNLKVTFHDSALQEYQQQLISTQQEKIYVTRAQPYQTIRIPPAHRRDRLHQLSELTLVSESRYAQVLLPENVSDSLAIRNQTTRNDIGLRRIGDAGESQSRIAPLKSDELLNEFSTQTALNWAEEYAKANRRKIVEAKPGDGLTIFSIIYTSSDGFVISQGRDISVHPKLDGQNFQAGNNVVINKNMELKFIEKSLGASKGR